MIFTFNKVVIVWPMKERGEEMLSVQSDGTIKLTRGDTARLRVYINNDIDDTEYDILENDELTFTVKKSVSDKTPYITKTIIGSNLFHIKPEDTSNLQFGNYKYDVQLTTESGDVYTVIGPNTFEITKEVTW